MLEAGHRCAIPTCRAVAPLQIDHIEDYAKVQRHEFENMIVLCANCHGLKGTGPRTIDRKALRQYKIGLRIVNSRYGEMERRALEYFAAFPDQKMMKLPGGMGTFVLRLVGDGILSRRGHRRTKWSDLYVDEHTMELNPDPEIYDLTDSGREFVDLWAKGLELEQWTPSQRAPSTMADRS